jgi:hypothetical protein
MAVRFGRAVVSVMADLLVGLVRSI